MSGSTEKRRFTIRASASRLEKGLLALPQKFKDMFPSEKVQIRSFLTTRKRLRHSPFILTIPQ